MDYFVTARLVYPPPIHALPTQFFAGHGTGRGLHAWWGGDACDRTAKLNRLN